MSTFGDHYHKLHTTRTTVQNKCVLYLWILFKGARKQAVRSFSNILIYLFKMQLGLHGLQVLYEHHSYTKDKIHRYHLECKKCFLASAWSVSILVSSGIIHLGSTPSKVSSFWNSKHIGIWDLLNILHVPIWDLLNPLKIIK